MINKVKTAGRNKLHKLLMYVYKVRVDVYPRSPFYSPWVEPKIILFNRFHIPLEQFKVAYTKDLHVDLDYIYETVPFHVLECHYPDNWWDQVDYARSRGYYPKKETSDHGN